jgi:hypothetical protein
MDTENFRPADLVESLEAAEAWSEALSKKKEPRLKAAAIGRYLAGYRFPSRDRQRSGSTYDRAEVLEVLERHIPLPAPQKGATSVACATTPVKIQVAEVAPERDEVPTEVSVPPEAPHQNPHQERGCGTVAHVAPNAGMATGISCWKEEAL